MKRRGVPTTRISMCTAPAMRRISRSRCIHPRNHNGYYLGRSVGDGEPRRSSTSLILAVHHRRPSHTSIYQRIGSILQLQACVRCPPSDRGVVAGTPLGRHRGSSSWVSCPGGAKFYSKTALAADKAKNGLICLFGIVNLTAPLCTAPAQCGILVPQPELLVRVERFPDTDLPS
jgi:hypothetical protein